MMSVIVSALSNLNGTFSDVYINIFRWIAPVLAFMLLA